MIFFEVSKLKNKLRTKGKSIKTFLQEMNMKIDVVTSSKRGLKLIDVEISIDYNFLAYSFQ